MKPSSHKAPPLLVPSLFVPSLFILSFFALACDGAESSPLVDAAPTPDLFSADAPAPTDSASTSGDLAAPGVLGIANLTDYQEVADTITVEVTTGPVTPSYVRLVVEGQEVARAESAPFSLSWDTTQQEDDLVWLRVETSDEQSETLSVMILNDGQRIVFDSAPARAGGEGELLEGAFEALGGAAFDPAGVEARWELPAGFSAVVMLLFWDNEAFEMQFEVGQGADRASGAFVVGGSSNYSPSNLWYSLTHRSSALTPGFCYAYVSPKEADVAVLAGQKTGFRLRGYLLR